MASDKLNLILAKVLGASEEPAFQRLTIFIPDKDKNGKAISDHDVWVRKGHEILTLIGGGATAFPPADGTWKNPENDKIVWEKTVMIYTFIDPDGFEKNLVTLRQFLHDFGRTTKQGEVAIEFEGRFYLIRDYDQGRRVGHEKKNR